MDDIIKKIEENKRPKEWVTIAREKSEFLKALVEGKNFKKILINRIEKIENSERSIVRQKHAKDIRDLFNRVYKPRQSVFNAFGGSIHNNLKGKDKERVENALQEFKGQKSLKKYLSENYFRLADTDPNGLIFVEYKEDIDIYPTYKSIQDIRAYESNGQLLKWVLFEPKNEVSGVIWRYVDDKKDLTIKEVGNTYTIIEEKSFEHVFGIVPAIVLSETQTMGSELRLSYVDKITELCEEYARDKSIKTSYKFLHGFPRHFRYVKECRECFGMKKTGEGKCKTCNGHGHVSSNDVSDVINIPLPREGENILASNVEGFITPDLETWKQYNEDLKNLEDLIDNTVWGTKRLQNNSSETATGRFIDVQPVINELSIYSDNVEWVANQLIYFVECWVNGSQKEEQELKIVFGKRFVIESQDVLLEKYLSARDKGANSSILDKILNEYTYSKYQNDVISLSESLKKIEIEPYIHNDIQEVNDIFGKKEAEKKVLFVDFWEQCDKNKDVDTLTKERDIYFEENSSIAIELISDIDNNGNQISVGDEITGDERPDVEAEAKARLKGSVGGVQGILGIQQSVASGQTQYDAAITVLQEIYGFDEAVAKRILGKVKIIKPINNNNERNGNS